MSSSLNLQKLEVLGLSGVGLGLFGQGYRALGPNC